MMDTKPHNVADSGRNDEPVKQAFLVDGNGTKYYVASTEEGIFVHVQPPERRKVQAVFWDPNAGNEGWVKARLRALSTAEMERERVNRC